MKSIILVALAIAAVAVAAPASSDPNNYETLRSEFVQQPEGSYVSSFETSNGIVRSETGELKQVINEEGKSIDVLVVRGSYGYPDANGKPITINFVADQLGYRAEGDSIPQIPARR